MAGSSQVTSQAGESLAAVRNRAARLAHPAVALLVVAVLAYGLLMPQMGFYWDELPMSWIRYELGPDAMTRYFSTNRPVWGLLYQVTTRILPHIPIYWEVLGLLLRWTAAVMVWRIARSILPANREFAVIAGLAFLLYPGFNQQWTSYLYSHFFIVLCFLLLSFLFSMRAVEDRRRFWAFTTASLLLSALNLWMMEYFFVLELFRPLLILRSVLVTQADADTLGAVRRTLRLWVPYLAVFAANVLWRLYVFNNQIYQPTLIPELRSHPLATLLELARAIGLQLYTATVLAWAPILQLPSAGHQGPRTVAFYGVVAALAAGVVAVCLLLERRRTIAALRPGWWPVGLGIAAMLAAGGPFWLSGLEVSTAYPANRFTLPFMLGASLMLAGLLALAPPLGRMWIAVGMLCLAAGRQALWAEEYRHDWITQKNLFWQMVWRAPGIEPNTMVLLNEGALPYYADNSLTGALNWIYDPDNRSAAMDYVLFYPTSRVGGTLPSLKAGAPVTYDFISEVFAGNTSQTLAFYYEPPGCLRLLDPLVDPENRLIPNATMMRDSASLSSSMWISKQAVARMPQIYQPEPTHGWCYHFQQAELAAQFGDWAGVAALGDIALALDDHPNNPVERFVFIEGYAHTDQWPQALEQSVASYGVSRTYMAPLLCALWGRIETETHDSRGKAAAVAEALSMLACRSD
jgi:hypothetical protein